MRSFASAATAASADLAAAKLDGDLAGIARDAAAYLQTMSKAVDDMSATMGRLTTAVEAMHVDMVKLCVEKPSHDIGALCGKATAPAECPTVLAALDAWGKAPTADVGSAMKAMANLTVADRTLKSRVGDIVGCTQPISAALDEVEKDKKELQRADSNLDQTPEHDIDARFKHACGRTLFNK